MPKQRYKEIIKAEINHARQYAEDCEALADGLMAKSETLAQFPSRAAEAAKTLNDSKFEAGRALGYRDMQHRLENHIQKAESPEDKDQGGDDEVS